MAKVYFERRAKFTAPRACTPNGLSSDSLACERSTTLCSAGLTHADRAESQGGGSDLETGLAADSSGAAAGATLSAAATPASLAALDNLASTLDKQAATMFFGSITVSATCVGRLSAAALAVATAAAAIHILLRCTLGSRREPKLPRNFLSIAGWVNMLLVFAVMYTAPPK